MSHTARTIFLSLAMLGAGSAGAQSHNPYAGQHERPIKALSEDDARAIGAKRVAAEKSLVDLFSSRAMDSQRLAEAVRTASQLEGEYRLSHLDTHRQMRALLSEQQVAQYGVLRGYAKEKHSH